jgi:acyl-CoA hydrolase
MLTASGQTSPSSARRLKSNKAFRSPAAGSDKYSSVSRDQARVVKTQPKTYSGRPRQIHRSGTGQIIDIEICRQD